MMETRHGAEVPPSNDTQQAYHVALGAMTMDIIMKAAKKGVRTSSSEERKPGGLKTGISDPRELS